MESIDQVAERIVSFLAPDKNGPERESALYGVRIQLTYLLDDAFRLIKNINDTSLSGFDRAERVMMMEEKYGFPQNPHFMSDLYFSRPEVSNSDLSELQKYWLPEVIRFDKEAAYKFGSLIDAMITEPHRLNYFQFTVDDVQYTKADFDKAYEMKKAFDRDPFCQSFVKQCTFQKVTIKPEFEIIHDRVAFTLPARCKWDLFCNHMDLSGDIKSTTATTQKQCEDVVRYFDYDRSRAWYMDLEDRSNDILIFISKVNFKVFKIPVKRDSDIYREGKAKYQELAFQYWSLFGDVKISLEPKIMYPLEQTG